MKKNKMMRVASVLLVAVLLTTSVISGTFAKYVTSTSTAATATVAKFGVAVTATGSLFDKTYFAVGEEKSNEPAGETADTPTTKITVESLNSNVVAPGTQSSEDGLTFEITGTPEVDVKINFTLENDSTDIFLGASQVMPDRTTALATDSFSSDAIYYPIVYTLADKDGEVLAAGTLKEIQDYLNTSAGELYVDANTDIANSDLGKLTLTWAWPFDTTTAGELETKLDDDYTGSQLSDVENRDKKDTLLGDLAAGTATENWSTPIKNPGAPNAQITPTDGSRIPVAGQDYSINTNVKITVTVTQVD